VPNGQAMEPGDRIKKSELFIDNYLTIQVIYYTLIPELIENSYYKIRGKEHEQFNNI